MLKLSQKYKEFLQTKCKREFLEGTTAAGKTTVGIFKFMCMVAGSDKKYHIIAGDDVGTVEKNVINSENGLLEQFEDIAEYWPKGKDKIRLPHIRYDKIMRSISAVLSVVLAGIGEETEETR